MAPPKRKYLFSDVLKREYPFLISDDTDHKHAKLVPILVRYFVPQQGVKMKNLEFTDLSGESSAQLTEHVVSVLKEAKLIDKVVSLSADNTNANFGGAKRRGKINVFERLRNKIK
jgi:hypothetical protein